MQAPTPSEKEKTPTQQPDETLLVLLAQAGDRTALEHLLRNLHAPLRRYITRLAGADLADDILQETSLQIFRKLAFLREPAVFRPWTLRIASRIAFAHLKRARRWQPLDEPPPEPLSPAPILGELPDAAFLALLDHVSPASRAVLLLHFQHDLSLEETAAVLEIPVGTAKSPSTTASPTSANTSHPKGNSHELRIPTTRPHRRNRLRPASPASRR